MKPQTSKAGKSLQSFTTITGKQWPYHVAASVPSQITSLARLRKPRKPPANVIHEEAQLPELTSKATKIRIDSPGECDQRCALICHSPNGTTDLIYGGHRTLEPLTQAACFDSHA
jgi:hypothetical protein